MGWDLNPHVPETSASRQHGRQIRKHRCDVPLALFVSLVSASSPCPPPPFLTVGLVSSLSCGIFHILWSTATAGLVCLANRNDGNGL